MTTKASRPNLVSRLIERGFARLRQRPLGTWITVMTLGFIATHVPPFQHGGPPPDRIIGADKLFHFVGFAGLSVATMHLLSQRRALLAAAALTFCFLAVYGVIDEVTQPFFYRSKDVHDWLADLLGITFGLGVWYLLRSRLETASDDRL